MKPAEAREAATRNPMHSGAISIIHEIISFVRSHISFEIPRNCLQAPTTRGFFSKRIKAVPKTAPITITLMIFGPANAYAVKKRNGRTKPAQNYSGRVRRQCPQSDPSMIV